MLALKVICHGYNLVKHIGMSRTDNEFESLERSIVTGRVLANQVPSDEVSTSRMVGTQLYIISAV